MSDDLAERISFAHQLGQVEGRIHAIERKVEAFEQRTESKLAAIDGKLDDLGALLKLGRGGWRLLLVIGTSIGTLAAVLKWLLDHAALRIAGFP